MYINLDYSIWITTKNFLFVFLFYLNANMKKFSQLSSFLKHKNVNKWATNNKSNSSVNKL